MSKMGNVILECQTIAQESISLTRDQFIQKLTDIYPKDHYRFKLALEEYDLISSELSEYYGEAG